MSEQNKKKKSQFRRLLWVLPVPSCDDKEILQLLNQGPVEDRCRAFREPLSFYLSAAFMNRDAKQIVIQCNRPINYCYLQDLLWPNLPEMAYFERKAPETLKHFLTHNKKFNHRIRLKSDSCHVPFEKPIKRLITSLEKFCKFRMPRGSLLEPIVNTELVPISIYPDIAQHKKMAKDLINSLRHTILLQLEKNNLAQVHSYSDQISYDDGDKDNCKHDDNIYHNGDDSDDDDENDENDEIDDDGDGDGDGVDESKFGEAEEDEEAKEEDIEMLVNRNKYSKRLNPFVMHSEISKVQKLNSKKKKKSND